MVVIGRNEGERLRRCLTSLMGRADVVVYVDSGSSDQSLATAAGMGVHTVALDMSKPFTAARGRNTGYRAAVGVDPHIEFVQFVDGDTEVAADWLPGAMAFLLRNDRAGAVFGRRRERHPDATVFNRLCDLEWDVPVGVVRYFGGDVMVRRAALDAVGGYDDDLIAGEEPELSLRLRHADWTLHRIDAEMTLHDAAMTQWGQWWKRAVRGGYAFAEGAYRHGKAPEYHWVRETWRVAIWGLALPFTILALSMLFSPHFLWLFLVFPAQIVRLIVFRKGELQARVLRAVFYTLARFPEAQGFVKFHWTRLRGRRASLIEYK